MRDIKCPYCNAALDIDHDDGRGYEEGTVHQQQCDACRKYFTFTTSVMYHYETFRADCLNEGEHDWQPTRTHPKCFSDMRCSICEESREPTEEEKIKHEIPSKEEYFKSLKTI